MSIMPERPEREPFEEQEAADQAQEQVLTPVQKSSLEAWALENPEEAEAIGRALQSDEALAGIFYILSTDQDASTEIVPRIMDQLKARYIPESDRNQLMISSAVLDEGTVLKERLALRWDNIRTKVMNAYVAFDAGPVLVDERPVVPGRSWGQKTWQEDEAEVASNPRKRILFADNPELRIVLTGPSALEKKLVGNAVFSKSTEFLTNRLEKPLTALETQAQKLNVFLDDSRPGKDILLDSAGAAANTVYDGIRKLMEYDEQFIAATCRMISALHLPENYAKARKFEDEMTDKIVDSIISSITNYDYHSKMDTARETLKPNPRQARALIAAGAAMACLVFTSVDTESSAENQIKYENVSSEKNPGAESTPEATDLTTNISINQPSVPISPLLISFKK